MKGQLGKLIEDAENNSVERVGNISKILSKHFPQMNNSTNNQLSEVLLSVLNFDQGLAKLEKSLGDIKAYLKE
jgi:hypothetical protein